MNTVNTKIKLFLILPVFLMIAGLSFADSVYKNNLVDVKVNKECGGAVKVTIYTDKPYNEPIVVNKKANNKYVILMPETKSYMKTEPLVSNTSGIISNVSVNTQEVSDGQGYTKIIITSQKAVTIIPAVQQLSITQKISPEKSDAHKAKQAAAQKEKQDNRTASIQKSKQETQAALQKTKQDAEKKAALQKAKQEAARKAALQKEKQKKIKNTVQKPPITPAPIQPIEVLKQEINTDRNAKFVSDNNDSVLKKEIKENTEKHALNKSNTLQEPNNKQSLIENLKTILKDYENISIWKLILLLGAIVFPLVVIMIILGLDKKINRRIDKSFPKENFTAGKPQQDSSLSYNSFDEMLDKAYKPIYQDVQDNGTKSLQHAQSVLQSEITNMSEENLKKEEIPKNEETILKEEETIKEIITEDKPAAEEEIITEPEFKDDFETEDFEHDFEKTNNETELPQEAELPQAPLNDIAGMEPYNPDGYLADFTNVNDKEFFDELVLQSLASGNSAGLPEESPADEVFNLLQDEGIKTENPTLNDSEFLTTVWSEKNLDSTPQTNSDNSVSAALGNDLTMLTEVKLNDNTGFYLVNYENFSSLVGHINDDYFVIKKFDDITNGSIILKQTEKLKNSARYMVRVGKNKMVVEVSPTSIDKILDL